MERKFKAGDFYCSGLTSIWSASISPRLQEILGSSLDGEQLLPERWEPVGTGGNRWELGKVNQNVGPLRRENRRECERGSQGSVIPQRCSG